MSYAQLLALVTAPGAEAAWNNANPPATPTLEECQIWEGITNAAAEMQRRAKPRLMLCGATHGTG